MVSVAFCLETSQIVSPHREALGLSQDLHPRGFVCVGCQQPMIFVAAGYKRGIIFPHTSAIKTAHFRHLDPDVERTCTYVSNSASESQRHLLLKKLQQERFQQAIDLNFKHDGLIVVPEKTIKSEGIYRRPDLSLLRNDKAFSGSEVQISALSPSKLWERANDHQKLGIKKMLWTFGDNASHSLETCLNMYGKAQTLRVRKKDVSFFADNGFIYQEEVLLGFDFEVWNLRDWNDRTLSNTAGLATIESDREFIEEAILESEKPETKTFILPRVKRTIVLPNIDPNRKLGVGDFVRSTDPAAESYFWRGRIERMHPTNPDLCFVDYPERLALRLQGGAITAFLSKLERCEKARERAVEDQLPSTSKLFKYPKSDA